MSQVTREQFLQVFQEGIDLYKEPLPKALEGTQALEQLRKADLNGDLKLTGKAELEKAFVIVEKFDPKAHAQSFEGDASPAAPLYHALLDTRLPRRFYTDDKMAAQNRSTIVCDGNGKIAIYIAPGEPDCALKCIEAHEMSHRSEAIKSDHDNTLCRDRAAGAQVHIQPDQRAASEIVAAAAELKCLDELKKKGDACKGEVEKQIQREVRYRDEFVGKPRK